MSAASALRKYQQAAKDLLEARYPGGACAAIDVNRFAEAVKEADEDVGCAEPAPLADRQGGPK